MVLKQHTKAQQDRHLAGLVNEIRERLLDHVVYDSLPVGNFTTMVAEIKASLLRYLPPPIAEEDLPPSGINQPPPESKAVPATGFMGKGWGNPRPPLLLDSLARLCPAGEPAPEIPSRPEPPPAPPPRVRHPRPDDTF